MNTVPGKKLVVLELYSGIGGMHYALEESGVQFDVVGAIDINQVSNSIYRHNFPGTKLLTKCLTRLTLSELNEFGADLVTMSPPCQPFTRVGRQRDVADERTKSFLHFLDLLPQLDKIPDYIFLENVKGFETSLTRELTLAALEKLNFSIQEFLLTPLQFSIPNSRLRYYMLASRKPLPIAKTPSSNKIFTTLHEAGYNSTQEIESLDNPDILISSSVKPTSTSLKSESRNATDPELCAEASDVKNHETLELVSISTSSFCDDKRSHLQTLVSDTAKRPLSDFLEDEPDDYFEQYLLPKKFYRYFWVMDLVQSDSANSCCFTKRYGHHIDGAGSVFQTKPSTKDLMKYRNSESDPDYIKSVDELRLRFFTPREIANLMCFPSHFSIPANVTTIQAYRALGNSINVYVVSFLLRLLLTLGESLSDKK